MRARAGVLIVAAAGNDGGAVGVPARLAGVIAVGAVDAALVRAPFSAGGRALDLVAPGVGIVQQTLDGAGGYADRSLLGHVDGDAARRGRRRARARRGPGDDGDGVARLLDAHGARPRRAPARTRPTAPGSCVRMRRSGSRPVP